MTDYPPQSGRQRIDVITCCDRCGVVSTLRDVPNTITARSSLLRLDGWTKRGKHQTEMWRCNQCSPVNAKP